MYAISKGKGRDMTQSYEKSPIPSENENVKRQLENTTNTSITQRLQNDLEQSVRLTTAI